MKNQSYIKLIQIIIEMGLKGGGGEREEKAF